MSKYTVHSYGNINFKDLHQMNLTRGVVVGEGTEDDIQREARKITSKGYRILAWIVNEDKNNEVVEENV